MREKFIKDIGRTYIKYLLFKKFRNASCRRWDNRKNDKHEMETNNFITVIKMRTKMFKDDKLGNANASRSKSLMLRT